MPSSDDNSLNSIYEKKVEKRAENLIQRHQQHLTPYSVELKNLTLQMQPNVFCAAYADGSQLLADVVAQEVQIEDLVLDMGTGSGAMAIIAAQYCKKVVAVDISPIAVDCARNNATINHVADRVEVRQGNLFDAVKAEEKFSLIVFNPPFMDGSPSDLLETAMYDRDYLTLKQFFSEFPKFLKPDGRLLIVFSEAGDIQILESLILQSGMKSEVVKSDLPKEYNLKVLTYKLS
jgi:release factor glutamine methyltransferase